LSFYFSGLALCKRDDLPTEVNIKNNATVKSTNKKFKLVIIEY